MTALTSPLPERLVSGGDTRTVLNPETGLNKYGCSPEPREALALGSCTSSSPSVRAYAAAEAALERLRSAEATGDATAPAAMVEEIRERLLRLLHCDAVPGLEVALTPSGTDAEMLVTALALGDGSAPLRNIVTAPAEVGGGTRQAAACEHFSELLPSGRTAEVGTPVDEDFCARVAVEVIRLRDESGDLRDDAAIDEQARALVEAALARGERVLLHLVAHSKTGAHVPSEALARELRDAAPDRVTVLVDAAQGRVGQGYLRAAVQDGFIVLFTGSKFYGGPPFSGALLVPESLSPATRPLAPLPAAFSDYFTRLDCPPSWRDFVAALPAGPAPGGLLRWQAALAEIEAWFAIAPELRNRIAEAFEAMVPRALGGSPHLKLDSVAPEHESKGADFAECTTVHCFTVHAPDGAAYGKAELKSIHAAVNIDLSRHAGEDAELAEILRPGFHIGQPVVIGKESGLAVLRVAMGAPLAVRLASETGLGAALEDRFQWLEGQLGVLRRKLDWLAENLELVTRDGGTA